MTQIPATNQGKLLLQMLEPLLQEFDKAYSKLHEDVEPLAHGSKNCDLATMLAFYVKLDAIIDKCKGLTTMCNIHMPELADKIGKQMIASDMDSIEMFGYKFSPTSKRYVTVTKDNQDAVVAWLKEHSEGKTLVSETYNANALTSFINTLIDEQGYSKDATEADKRIPAAISTFEKPQLAMRKVKGK